MKVLHLCFADSKGGAAIGARRLHQSMLNNGVDSRLLVTHKFTKDDSVVQLPRNKRLRHAMHVFNRTVSMSLKSGNPVFRSLNLLPTGVAKYINAQDADIVQMHWIGQDTISIGEVADIAKPVVWKLPDMWAFSGAAHYSLPSDPLRYQEGYSRANRPPHESGFDLEKWLWRYKKWRWAKADINIVGPSRWIVECARQSVLFRNSRVRHILNPLDLQTYRPMPKAVVREEFGLPADKQIVMFGAMHATSDRRKGFHHLKSALALLTGLVDPAQVVFAVLGSDGPKGETIGEFEVFYLGVIHDEAKLVRAYNTADVFVLPAEMDNLPNVIKEATCCGVPCVGFDVGGMPDMIHHLETGYLASPFDPADLAGGIQWTLERTGEALTEEVWRRAATKHDPQRAVREYLSFYDEILSSRS